MRSTPNPFLSGGRASGKQYGARHLSGFFLILFSLAILVAPAPPCLAADEPLNNDSIIQLRGLNLGDAVIIEKIKNSTCNFDTSIKGLTQLKAANISDAVIREMIAAKPPPPAAGSAPAPDVADPNDPATPHAPGIWVLREADGKKTLTQVEGESAEISHGGFIGPFGIGKVAQTAHFSAQSDLQLSGRRPVFYFYFGSGQLTGLQAAMFEFSAGNSPRNIVLAHCNINAKKGDKPRERVLELSRSGAYGGSSGIAPADAREMTQEAVAEGIYKVMPKNDLPDGEYTFCPPEVLATRRFYTFGVQAK